jgi:hypothetical protein
VSVYFCRLAWSEGMKMIGKGKLKVAIKIKNKKYKIKMGQTK